MMKCGQGTGDWTDVHLWLLFGNTHQEFKKKISS